MFQRPLCQRCSRSCDTGKRSRGVVFTTIPGRRNGLPRSFRCVAAFTRLARVGSFPAFFSASTIVYAEEAPAAAYPDFTPSA